MRLIAVRFLTVWLFLGYFIEELAAQQPTNPFPLVCGTPEPASTQKLQLKEQGEIAFNNSKLKNSLSPITYVPIRPHIFRRSNGTGEFDLSKLNQVMALTNSYYLRNNSGIQFYFAGTSPDYIDNDAAYASYTPYDEQPIQGRDVTNAMNQYYVNSFSQFGLGGYAYYPGDYLLSTRSVILAGSGESVDDLGNRLIPHEFGHNYNLFHTFGPSNGTASTDEYVTRGSGANCSTAGDLICDTPADPYGMPNAYTSTDNNGCPYYTGSATDAHGDAFAPSITNIMSYYYPCTHDFTPGQYDRVQQGLALRKSHTSYSLDYPPANVAAPTNLSVTLASGGFTLTWQDNASNEMGYFIERSTSPTTDFVAIGGVAPDVTTFTDSKASRTTVYYYRIRPSNTTTGSVSSTVPTSTSIISGLSATNITGNTAQLNWTSLGANVYYDIRWRKQGDPYWSSNTYISTNTYTLNSLFPNTAYEWQVKWSGSETYSSPASFTTPCSAPGSLYTSTTRTTAALSWYSNVNTYSAYALRWRATGTTDWTMVNGITLSNYSLTGLSTATPYEWQLQGVCSASATSSFSDTQSFTTLSCQAPSVSVSNYSLGAHSVQFYAYDTYSEPGKTYDFRYRAVGATDWQVINNFPLYGYTLSGLTNNTTYEWQVRSVCSASERSGYTASSTFRTVCAVPTGLSSSALATKATLSWYLSSGTGASFDLQYRASGQTDWTTISGITTTAYSLTGLSTGLTYEYRIRTNCSGGDYSDYSSTSTFTTSCRPVDYLSTASLTYNAVTLNWSHYSAEAGTLYELRYRVAGTSDWTTISSLIISYSNGTYSLTDLTNNTTYEWQIRSVCSASASSPFTAGPSFTTQCVKPEYGYANSYANSASLFWSGTVANLYEMRYRATGSTGSANWTTISNLTTASYSLTGLSSSTNYEWQVRSRCAEGVYSDFSTSSTFKTLACPAPGSLNTGTIQAHTAQLSWYDSYAEPGKTYELRYRATGAADWTSISSLTISYSYGAYSLTGLTNNTTYEWQVRSVCSASERSDYTASSTFRTVCPIPTGLSSSALATKATLSWYQPYGTSTLFDLQYRAIGTPDWTTISGITTTAYSLTGLSTGLTYEYRIRTNCSGGDYSDYSSTSTFTTSCRPVDYLSTASLTYNAVTLNWSHYSAEAGTLYELRYRAIGAPDWTPISGLTASNGYGTYSLTGLINNTTYEWQMRSVCSASERSAYTASNTFRTVCPIPTGLSSSVSATRATLFWYLSSGIGASFDVQYRASGQTDWTTVSGLTTTAYSLTGLNTGLTYEYRIRTNCSGSDYSDYSAINTFTTACKPVSSLYTNAVTYNSVSLSWYVPIAEPTTYELRYRPVGAPNWSTISSLTANSTSVTYTLAGLTNNTTYEWQLKQICSPVDTSSYTTGATFTTRCNAPYSVSYTTYVHKASFSWQSVSSDALYELHYRPSGTTNWTVVSGLTTASYTLTGLSSNTNYDWQVRTQCGPNQYSEFSTLLTFTMAGCTIPIFLQTSSQKTNAARLSWYQPTWETETRFEIQWRAVGDANWTSVSGLTAALGNGLYQLTGLSPNTSYEWQIRTLCSADEHSGFSETQTFKSLDCPTMYSVKDGNWNDPVTWSCNRVPTGGDSIQIKHVVTVPGGFTAQCLNLSFDVGKTLKYEPLSRLQISP